MDCRKRALVPALLALTWVAAAGCIPLTGAQTGEEYLGDFSLLANATEDSCLSTRFGPSLTFPLSLSRTKEVFYFGGPGGVLQGTIIGNAFSVTYGGYETLSNICTVTREETMTGTIDGSTLTGNYTIRVIPQQGYNCTAVVLTRQFATLPCQVRYQVTGQRTDDAGTGDDDGGTSDGGTDADGGAQ